MKKPNILWILTDQQSANMMSCMGNRFVNTPNIDYLAKKGVLFENTYCTNPVCLPSRFSLFTGLYPGEIGLKSNEFADEIKEMSPKLMENGLGHLLKTQGYQAVYGGKQHLPYMSAELLGFDYLCSDEREGLADRFSEYIRNYQETKPLAMVASFINPHDICLMAISDFAKQSDNDGDQWIVEHFHDAVTEVKAAAQIPVGMHPDVFYECVCPDLPDNYLPAADEPEAIAMMQSKRRFKQLARQQYIDYQWRLHRYAYARLTEQADRQIGKLLAALKDRGMWDNTVIIFTSDHGDMDASHKMEHKTALYQECCKVPLIIKGIDAPADKRDQRLVSNGLDCICTVMEYAGIQKPEYLRGISLKPVLEESDRVSERNSLIVESEYGTMVVDKKGKYVRYFAGARNEQFYHLDVNPGEQYNQIHEEKYCEHIETLKQAVDRHLKYKSAELKENKNE